MELGYAAYVTVLRLKQAEYESLSQLNESAKAAILPHFIIPPPSKKDQETRRLFSGQETIQFAATRVGRFWLGRRSLVDVRFIASWAHSNQGVGWLKSFLTTIRSNGGIPVPVATLRDIEGPLKSDFVNAITANKEGMALRLTLSDLGDDGLKTRIHNCLLALALKPHECILLLDFADADFSSVDIIQEQYRIYFEEVYEIGLWSKVVFQGTSYPDKNISKPGHTLSRPRNDWLSWREATTDKTFLSNTLFSDYASDTAIFRFGPARARAICHLRYSTADTWEIIRAGDALSDRQGMKSICETIRSNPYYAGRNFSWGDQWIDDCVFASGKTSGSTIWRMVNLTHHFSRVLSDVSGLIDREFRPYTYQDRGVQERLF